MCGLLMLPVLILNFVINLIRWLFSRFGWWAFLIIVAVVIILVIVVSSVLSPGPAVTNIVSGLPSVSEAPYLVETSSRYYYAEAYTKDGETVILEGYWALEGDRWVHYDRIVLTPAFGEVEIGKRR